MEIQPRTEYDNGGSDDSSDSSTVLPRFSSLSLDSEFSDMINAWEAELDAQEAGPEQRTRGTAGANTSTHIGGSAGAGGSSGNSNDADTSSSRNGAGVSGAPGGSSGPAARGVAPTMGRPSSSGLMPLPRRPATASAQPASPSPRVRPPPHRRPFTAVVGVARPSCPIDSGGSKLRAFSSVPSGLGSGSAQTNAATAGGANPPRRRAAFVAGGNVRSSQRKPDAASSTPGRDILLPRLPATALDLIVPVLPPASRAALRCVCKGLRTLVDAHTHSLTLRPDRRVADDLNRRGTKVFTLFPALRHATVILAGSCSGAPSSAVSPAAGAQPSGARNAPSGSAAGRRASSAVSCGTGAAGARAAGVGLLPLSSWLLMCGITRCLTSLTMHVGDVALTEGLAMVVTHLNLQRMELFIGLTGHPHASPPTFEFIIGMLRRLRHVGLTWAGGPGGVNGTANGGGVPTLASLAHGSRRPFLDGRPRLGPGLLAALADLSLLESLELRGFLLDTEGHAVLSRNWPRLAARLQRLVISQLHIMLPSSTPQEQQLGELVGSSTRLRELHADLCLPAPAGMPGIAAAAGGPGAAAAALLISSMNTSRDLRAIRAAALPVSLTRLCLPGFSFIRTDELEPLSRLRSLTSLQVTALGSSAGEYLTALQELRLVDCYWRQLLKMLPWRAVVAQQPARCTASAAQQPSSAAAAVTAASTVAAAAALRLHAQRQADQASEPLQGVAGLGRDAEAGRQRDAASGVVGNDDGVTRGAFGGPTGAFSAGPVEGAQASACGQLKCLEVVVCERLDDWEARDRNLLTRVGKAMLPLVDGGCRVKLQVAQDAQPNIWNESDEDGKPWEPLAVWRHIKAAQNLRRLQAETKAVAERLARGRMLQAARRKNKELQFASR